MEVKYSAEIDTVSPAASVKLEVPSKSVVVPGPVVVICTRGLAVRPKYGGRLVMLNGELRLLEIGCDPNIIERHNVHEFLSDTHVLAHFDASLADNSRHGRKDHRVAEVHLCLRKLSRSLQHLGVGGLRVGASQRNLLRRRLRSLQIVFCLREFPLSLLH